MSEIVLIIGDSGAGKSTSIKSLDPNSTFIINVIDKPLPFAGWKGKYTPFGKANMNGNIVATTEANRIIDALKHIGSKMPQIKTVIIDDGQYIMSFEWIRRVKERGFDKYNDIGKHFFDIIDTAKAQRGDLTVIFLQHSEEISSNGYTKTKIKTIGKLLDEKITLEGLFTVVLLAQSRRVEKKMEYSFLTNSDGTSTCKSPDGMFDAEIPNDLQLVLDGMKRYYEGDVTKVNNKAA